MSHPKKMKFLIAGLGSIGRRHLKNLMILGYDDIILYRTGKGSLGEIDKDFPVFTTLDSAMAENPDAVIISNPTALHMPVAEMAARSGAHIFLEKPISHTLDSLYGFESILEKSKSKVFVAYQFRFNPGLEQIKEMLSKEIAGRPVSFISRWGEYLPDWHPWEDYRESYAARPDLGGGVVLTLSHPIDYLRWFFGEVRTLIAEVGNKSNLALDCEDFADVKLTFRNGVEGSLHLDYFSRPKVHDLQIQCEKGTINWDFASNTVVLAKGKGDIEKFLPPDQFERNQMYLDEMAHFVEVCLTDQKPHCTYEDGKKTLDIGLGILQSGRYDDRVIFEE